MTGIIVDNFAGGGGASTGFELAGHRVDVALNHSPEALAMHIANHPDTRHVCQDIMAADPREVTQNEECYWVHFSPDCTHHSKAAGGVPRSKRVRDLAWIVNHWAWTVKPDVISLENVEEFCNWGPLLHSLGGMTCCPECYRGFPDREPNRPCPDCSGLTFHRWLRDLRSAGYAVEYREIRACDHGTPTIRKRLYLIARRDGRPIVWPAPTHGPGLLPYRTASECIDWTNPCPSIFERSKPLADATCRRIARGIFRFVLDCPRPFLVPITHTGSDRCNSLDEPMRTITCANRGEHALVSPIIAGCGGRAGQSRERGGDEPMHTVTSKADACVVLPTLMVNQNNNVGRPLDEPCTTITTGGHHALVSAFGVPRYGERDGQDPRCFDLESPLHTITPDNNSGRIVAAYMAQHNLGNVGRKIDDPLSTIVGTGSQQQIVAAWLAQHNADRVGRSAEDPLSTITTRGMAQQVVTSHLAILRNNQSGQSVEEPLGTLCAAGNHFAEVRAFLVKYYGNGTGQDLREPLDTITTRDRFGLVVVDGWEYAIVDIGMRMLSARELFNCQGFPSTYIIDAPYRGGILSKTAQIKCCGNSVCPQVMAALVRANHVTETRRIVVRDDFGQGRLAI